MVIPEKILALFLLCSVPSAIAVSNLTYEIEETPVPVVEEIVLEDLVDTDELFCLSQNIYFEARNEPVDGWKAVGHVTLNRVESEKFPDSICDVVHQARLSRWHLQQGREVPIRNQCQFSWYCDGQSDAIRNWQKFDDITTIARDVIRGKYVDNTEGSTYYHADYVNPRWRGVIRTTKIGRHIFYRTASG